MASGTQADYGFDIPALIYPAVVEGMIVTRREHEVAATDLDTGASVWRVSDRSVYTGARGKTVNRYVPLAGDMGRYTVTVAGGNVYTIAGLRRIDPETYRKFASSLEVDSSSLIALSASDGSLRWEIGAGKGDNDVVRKAKFLTAPTYYGGRLFSLVKVWNRYHLICLSPTSGETVWKSSIGPIPTHAGEQLSWQAAYTMELMTERASQVAASDGIVYLTTNSGLVAAFDAATGRALWAYRYDSDVSGKAGAGVREVANLAFLISAARSPFPPQNAVIVSGGRVISLPCDSRTLLALDGVTGELMWQIARKGYRHLTAIDEERLLLSDPGFRVISAVDGTVVYESDERICDRPAVTRSAVIASAPGRIVQMDLATYETDTQDVSAPEPILGTMVSSGGKLVAANAGGVTAYLGFDDAWKVLTERLEAARDDATRRRLRVERGAIALRSGRYERATKELLQAESLAKDNANVRRGVRRSLYKAYMALASTAGDGARPCFARALSYAASGADEAGVVREQIVAHLRAKNWVDAVACAQSLRKDYASAPLELRGSDGMKGEWVDGRTYGRLKIAEIVTKHGAVAGAALNASANKALTRAGNKENVDGLLGVWEEWPNADCAGEALMRAAEAQYSVATAGSPPDLAAMRRAHRILSLMPRTAVRARGAQYIAQSVTGPVPSPGAYADLLSVPPATRISFGATSVTLSNVAARLGVRVENGDYDAGPASFSGPAEPAFCSVEKTIALLRDFDGKALLLGDLAFVNTRTHAFCLDARRDSYGESRLWEVELHPVEEFPARVAVLTRDRRRLVILGPQELVILEAASGRAYNRCRLKDLGISGWQHGVVDGDRLVIADGWGNLTGVDLRIGRREWRRNVRGLSAQSLQAGTDVLMCVDDRGRGVTVLDTRTGRHLHRAAARGWNRTPAFLNRDGIMVWLKGDELELVDPRLGGLGVLKTVPLGTTERDIVHFGRSVLLLRDSKSRDVLFCGDVGTSLGLAETRLSIGEKPLALLDAVLVGSTTYVLCGQTETEERQAHSLHILALSAPEGTELWRKRISPAGDIFLPSKPRKYDGVVSILLRPKEGAEAARYAAVDVRTGTVCEYVAGAVGPRAGPARRAAAWAGSPAVLNGRVVAETEAGIVCLRAPL